MTEEKGAVCPIRSNPALQKAEMLWKTPYHSPSQNPKRGMNRSASSTAPMASKVKVQRNRKPVARSTPPIWGRPMDSRMRNRCRSPIFLPLKRLMNTAMVTKPSPPTWISVRMTACPNSVQWLQVSYTTSPVTQVAEVAVNSALRKGTDPPSRLAAGSINRPVPARIMSKNPSAMTCAGEMRRSGRFRSFMWIPLKSLISFTVYHRIPQ